MCYLCWQIHDTYSLSEFEIGRLAGSNRSAQWLGFVAVPRLESQQLRCIIVVLVSYALEEVSFDALV